MMVAQETLFVWEWKGKYSVRKHSTQEKYVEPEKVSKFSYQEIENKNIMVTRSNKNQKKKLKVCIE